MKHWSFRANIHNIDMRRISDELAEAEVDYAVVKVEGCSSPLCLVRYGKFETLRDCYSVGIGWQHMPADVDRSYGNPVWSNQLPDGPAKYLAVDIPESQFRERVHLVRELENQKLRVTVAEVI